MAEEHERERELTQEKYADDPALDPYEIEFLPQYRVGRGSRAPFLNQYGVVIGDHQYESPNSPLSEWSVDTDPAVMAGEEWVHPFKDVGFQTEENRNIFEKGLAPQGGIFTHPDKNAAYSVGEPDKYSEKMENEQPE